MSRLTDLINQLSTETAQTRITNEEFRRLQEILLDIRIEARTLENRVKELSSFSVDYTISQVTGTPPVTWEPCGTATDTVL